MSLSEESLVAFGLAHHSDFFLEATDIKNSVQDLLFKDERVLYVEILHDLVVLSLRLDFWFQNIFPLIYSQDTVAVRIHLIN